jgi:hypothetical protein
MVSDANQPTKETVYDTTVQYGVSTERKSAEMEDLASHDNKAFLAQKKCCTAKVVTQQVLVLLLPVRRRMEKVNTDHVKIKSTRHKYDGCVGTIIRDAST